MCVIVGRTHTHRCDDDEDKRLWAESETHTGGVADVAIGARRHGWRNAKHRYMPCWGESCTSLASNILDCEHQHVLMC